VGSPAGSHVSDQALLCCFEQAMIRLCCAALCRR
jgi:hypothetical protein